MGTKEANSSELGKARTIDTNKIGDGAGIERVAENDFMKNVKEADWTSQPVRILVHESVEKGSLDFVSPGVNGVFCPIKRGVPTTVQRKFVEALARCRRTVFEQVVPDPSAPHRTAMKEKTIVANPFTVLSDNAKGGAAWLKAILRSA